jgi:hypothetical protein
MDRGDETIPYDAPLSNNGQLHYRRGIFKDAPDYLMDYY